MNWILKLIWKRRLRKRYIAYRRLLDEYPCGGNLARYVSHRVGGAEEYVNEAIRKCRKYDPECQLREIV